MTFSRRPLTFDGTTFWYTLENRYVALVSVLGQIVLILFLPRPTCEGALSIYTPVVFSSYMYFQPFISYTTYHMYAHVSPFSMYFPRQVTTSLGLEAENWVTRKILVRLCRR